MAALGMCFDRTFPPGTVTEFAARLEADGVDQLWVIEDCFFSSAPPLAAAALAATQHLTVGVGILPARTRTAALTAMELATLARMGPGRVVAGIGHGVQDWMAQMGVRPTSPLAALEEVLTSVRRLLAGETVSLSGQFVTLDDVALQPAPDVVPPVLAGVRGPRSLELAGRCADGLVLAEWIGPTYVRHARSLAGRSDGFRVATYSTLSVDPDPRIARSRVAAAVASQLREGTPNVAAHPRFEDLRERADDGGLDALVDAPAADWHELGAVGTLEDAITHVALMDEAGVDDVALFPAPDVRSPGPSSTPSAASLRPCAESTVREPRPRRSKVPTRASTTAMAVWVEIRDRQQRAEPFEWGHATAPGSGVRLGTGRHWVRFGGAFSGRRDRSRPSSVPRRSPP